MNIGQRVREARQDLDYTQEELAQKVDVTREAINRIENSSRNVKVGELVRLSDVLLRPLDYFLLSEQPDRLAVTAYRCKEDPTRGVKEAELWLREKLANFAKLRNILGMSHSETIVSQLHGRRVLHQAQQAAREQRKLWGLGVDPIDDLRGRIEEHARLPIFGREVCDNDDFCGILVLLQANESVAMLVNSALPYDSRRRFTIAHEFGHYLWKISRRDFSPDILFIPELVAGDSSDEETFANTFAAHFLAPDEAIRSRCECNGAKLSDSEFVMSIGAEFGLSFQAMTYRLQNLALIPEQEAERLRTTTRPTLLPSFRNEWEPFATMSQLFRKMVMDAYFEGALSAGRCAEMLDISTAEFMEHLEQANTDTFEAAWLLPA